MGVITAHTSTDSSGTPLKPRGLLCPGDYTHDAWARLEIKLLFSGWLAESKSEQIVEFFLSWLFITRLEQDWHVMGAQEILIQ